MTMKENGLFDEAIRLSCRNYQKEGMGKPFADDESAELLLPQKADAFATVSVGPFGTVLTGILLVASFVGAGFKAEKSCL